MSLILAMAVPQMAAGAAAPTPETQAVPGKLSPDVRAVIEQALAGGDAAAIEAVVRYAVAAHPEAEAEIRALQQAAAAVREEVDGDPASPAASAGIFQNWDGSIELGAARSTGSTNSLGLFGAVDARRVGVDWTHRLVAKGELQESNGARTVERLSAEWQPRLKVSDRVYGFGIAQYERDPFAGLNARYSAGLGAGYALVGDRDLNVELEGGLAFRQTHSRGLEPASSLAGRASLGLNWRLSDALEIRHSGAMFVARDTANGSATTALDAAILGPLRLRLSYEIRFERNDMLDARSTSTASRATFVYGF